MTQLRPVSLTPDALEQVKAIMESKAVPDGYGLRIGVKSSGCAGLGFMLGFDKIAENDMSYDEQGVLVIIEKKHAMYLAGKQVDYSTFDGQAGFVFEEEEEHSPS